MSDTEDRAPHGLSAMGGTFAERAAYRKRMAGKSVDAKVIDADEAEDKAVTRASTKARKTAAKKP